MATKGDAVIRYTENFGEKERWLAATLGPLSAAGHTVVKLGPKGEEIEIVFTLKSNGVGSKVTIANALRRYDTIGIDAVALSVNDTVAMGARPLLLCQYLVDDLEDESARSQILKGVKRGLALSAADFQGEHLEPALMGGEVAKNAAIIRNDLGGYAFDLSTTCFGMTDPRTLVDGERVVVGDVIIGVESSGLHSNGYSLFRPHMFREFNPSAELSLHHEFPEGGTWGDQLLEPTRNYSHPILNLVFSDVSLHGICHISNRGFRKLRDVCPTRGVMLLDDLPTPPAIFSEILARIPGVAPETVYATMNMGIGMCVIVPQAHAGPAVETLSKCGVRSQVIGRIVPGKGPAVRLSQQNVTY